MVFLKTYMSLKLDLSESFALQINCFSNRMVKYTKLGVLFTLTKSLDIEIFSDEIFCYLTFCPSLPPSPPPEGKFQTSSPSLLPHHPTQIDGWETQPTLQASHQIGDMGLNKVENKSMYYLFSVSSSIPFVRE